MKIYAFLALIFLFGTFGCKTSKSTVKLPTGGGHITIKKTPMNGDKSMITGTIKDMETSEDLIGARVVIQDNQGKMWGAETDISGNFTIANLPADGYNMTISYMGYRSLETPLKVEQSTQHTLTIGLLAQPMTIEKPIIYLYPTKKQAVSVVLDYEGELVHTYPKYPLTGWKVIADTDGTLWDEKGQEYYALFWEGLPNKPLIPQEGFIVSGEETASFLEEKLAFLGLNRREANEFILYWLPRMENNPYNLIHFSGDEYTHTAALQISPQPETLIRVMMITQPLPSKIDFPLQDLTSLKKTRKGFTVVEWGGSSIHHSSINAH